jgi:2-deoxy-D-gluconate 3-dehydrogenase
MMEIAVSGNQEFMSTFSLAGKTAVVTGASRGIGQAIAVGLARAGANIIGVSSRMSSDGATTGDAVRAAGGTFHGLACDFADHAAVTKLAQNLRRDHGSIDILVNNAGTIRRAPAIEHSDDDWNAVIDINLNAQFVLSRELGSDMVTRGSGKIIFIASLLTFQGGITVPGYAAAKAGIGGLTKALANEWAAKGVNVNAIAPGYISTDNTEALRANPERNRDILARIPAERWGDVKDLVGPVVFLASDASQYVHGHIMLVDGGWMGR